MPYNNLPFLGLNDDKYVHNAAPAPPIGNAAAGTVDRGSFVGLAALAALLLRGLHRTFHRQWGASGESLRKQEEQQFNLLTHYVNSRRRL